MVRRTALRQRLAVADRLLAGADVDVEASVAASAAEATFSLADRHRNAAAHVSCGERTRPSVARGEAEVQPFCFVSDELHERALDPSRTPAPPGEAATSAAGATLPVFQGRSHHFEVTSRAGGCWKRTRGAPPIVRGDDWSAAQLELSRALAQGCLHRHAPSTSAIEARERFRVEACVGPHPRRHCDRHHVPHHPSRALASPESGARISAAPSSPTLPLSPRSKRARPALARLLSFACSPGLRYCNATHSAISPRPVGRLDRPDNAQAGRGEAAEGRRAAALIERETPGSPRLRQSRGTSGRVRRRPPNCVLPTTAGWGQTTADSRARASPTDESRTVGNADLAPRLLARLWNSPPATMSDSATVKRGVRVVRPGGCRRKRERSLVAASYGCWPMNLMSIRSGSQRRLGRPSAVIAGATVTDWTVSVISRRQAAKRFAGSRNFSMS